MLVCICVTVYLMFMMPENTSYLRTAYFHYCMFATPVEAQVTTYPNDYWHLSKAEKALSQMYGDICLGQSAIHQQHSSYKSSSVFLNFVLRSFAYTSYKAIHQHGMCFYFHTHLLQASKRLSISSHIFCVEEEPRSSSTASAIGRKRSYYRWRWKGR